MLSSTDSICDVQLIAIENNVHSSLQIVKTIEKHVLVMHLQFGNFGNLKAEM